MENALFTDSQASGNRQSPLFKELRDLTRKVRGAAPLLKEALLTIESKIEIAFLYGLPM